MELEKWVQQLERMLVIKVYPTEIPDAIIYLLILVLKA